MWLKHSVYSHLTRQRDKGIIRRVRQAKLGIPAVYARKYAQVESQPFDSMTLEQVMLQVLTKPLTTVELTLAMLDPGYQTSMAKHALRNAVGRQL